jgi:RNA polymerase sigma-70 factor (ECF subfamily)
MGAADDPRTDDELLFATAREPEAFAVFYRRHVHGVLAFFRRRVVEAEIALDLTAETFAAALEASGRYERRREPARAWLYGIARNKLREAWRAGVVQDRARRALGMEPIVVSDEGLAAVEQASDQIGLPLLDALPADQEEAIRARHLDGQEYSEIAAELRCSESVVRKRVSRGLKTLRDQLKEAGGA